MSVEHIGNGYVKICVSEEELENSIAGLSQLKPILQAQAMKGNGRNTKQGLIDAAELGKHFDTAIDAMTMLLAGFKEESEADGAESYGTPKKMAEAMSADLSVKTADGSLYADDTLSESVTEFASGTLKLGIKDLTPEVLAELLGQAVDKNSVVWAGKEDEPPYVAVGFRAKKTGGKYRYVWLLKAKFKVPSEKYETKGESIKFNTPDIEASFTTRKKDNLWKADFVGTEESAAAKTWFTAVPEKAAAMESV